MATQLSTLTRTALDAAERSIRIHQWDAHQGQSDFACETCLALHAVVTCCKTAWEATDTVVITRNQSVNTSGTL